MKMKKLASLVLALVMCVALAVPAMAAVALSPTSADTLVSFSEARPRIHFHGTAKLDTESWLNITSSDNFFADRPLVTSDANNPGIANIRVVNEAGAIVCASDTVSAGGTLRLTSIPAGSGTYTIQGKAVSHAGSYTFDIN